jgi:prepilin-type N-terminal cleavage/methylation domain-containing protein
MKARGFTMIELLVVLAILGVLLTLGIGSYTKSLSRGRDAKRVEDMKQVQRGFEQYYALVGSYGANCQQMFSNTQVFPSGELTPPSGGYIYFGTCSATVYEYCTRLENGLDYGNSTCSPVTSVNVAECSPASSNQTHYCVSNLQ